MNVGIERVWRDERARLVARLARRTGDLHLAEDAVQDAFASAAALWSREGTPDRPGAWLATVAWRRALDVLRKTARADVLALSIAEMSVAFVDDVEQIDRGGPCIDDDFLGLVLACAHPAMAPEARVALTLRHVAGLHAREIAAAFLVDESAMEKRLVRARRKLRLSGISLELENRDAVEERLDDVRTVISLIFTEGHLATSAGPPIRAELCGEAIWLARAVARLVQRDTETTALLASLLFTHARVDARLDRAGKLVPFDRQDRSRWNAPMIEEARRLLATTLPCAPGPYALMATIGAIHVADIDPSLAWRRIAELYDVLSRLAPSPLVALNRAYAIGRARGPRAGLRALEAVLADGRLARYAPMHAAHADLLERAGDPDAASAAWQRAGERAPSGSRRDAYWEHRRLDER